LIIEEIERQDRVEPGSSFSRIERRKMCGRARFAILANRQIRRYTNAGNHAGGRNNGGNTALNNNQNAARGAGRGGRGTRGGRNQPGRNQQATRGMNPTSGEELESETVGHVPDVSDSLVSEENAPSPSAELPEGRTIENISPVSFKIFFLFLG
jgi:hypothetical protein